MNLRESKSQNFQQHIQTSNREKQKQNVCIFQIFSDYDGRGLNSFFQVSLSKKNFRFQKLHTNATLVRIKDVREMFHRSVNQT